MNDTFKTIIAIPDKGKAFVNWYNSKYGLDKLKWFQNALFEEQLGVYLLYISELYGNRFHHTKEDDIVFMIKNNGLPF